jgi:hypothetical protein
VNSVVLRVFVPARMTRYNIICTRIATPTVSGHRIQMERIENVLVELVVNQLRTITENISSYYIRFSVNVVHSSFEACAGQEEYTQLGTARAPPTLKTTSVLLGVQVSRLSHSRTNITSVRYDSYASINESSSKNFT